MSSSGASPVKPLSISESTEIICPQICDAIRTELLEHTHKPNYPLHFKSNDFDVFICVDKDIGRAYALSYRHLLGEGGQGKVVLAQCLNDNKLVAAKIQTSQSLEASFDYAVKKERNNLKQHKQLIDACDFREPNGNVIAVTFMSYYPGVDLLNFLYKTNPHEPKDSVNYYGPKQHLLLADQLRLVKLALGELIGLHKNGLAHGDLKPSNFVINPTRSNNSLLHNMHLVDLGSAIDVSGGEVVIKINGSPGYVPPDCLHDKSYDFFSDYFAFGVVLCEILSEKPYEHFIRHYLKEMKEKQATAVSTIKEITRDQITDYFSDIFFPDEEMDRYLSKFDNPEDKATAYSLILFARTLCQPYEKRELRGNPAHLDRFYLSLHDEEQAILKRSFILSRRRSSCSSSSSIDTMLEEEEDTAPSTPPPPLSPRYTPGMDASQTIRRSFTTTRARAATDTPPSPRLDSVFKGLSLT